MSATYETRGARPGAGDRAHGIVLCGGRSRRMGRDKARLRLGESSLIERAVAVLLPLTSEVVLACGPADRYGDLGPRRVVDELADGGPLAGIAAGIADARGAWSIAIAVDMPRLSTAVLAALLAAARERDLDACFLETDGGIEPLCGVWNARVLPAVRAALAAGERRVVAFERHPLAPDGAGVRLPRVGTVRARALGCADVATNVNTPAEFAALAEPSAEVAR